MGQLPAEVLRMPKVSSSVPAAPWVPATVIARSRAVHAAVPAGLVVVDAAVVEVVVGPS